MAIKTFRDVATSLIGSAFRRSTSDGRTRMVREIATLGRLVSGRRRVSDAQASKADQGSRG